VCAGAVNSERDTGEAGKGRRRIAYIPVGVEEDALDLLGAEDGAVLERDAGVGAVAGEVVAEVDGDPALVVDGADLALGGGDRHAVHVGGGGGGRHRGGAGARAHGEPAHAPVLRLSVVAAAVRLLLLSLAVAPAVSTAGRHNAGCALAPSLLVGRRWWLFSLEAREKRPSGGLDDGGQECEAAASSALLFWVV